MTQDMLTAIADQCGTPTYVYDLDQVRAQYKKFTSAFDWPQAQNLLCHEGQLQPGRADHPAGYGLRH